MNGLIQAPQQQCRYDSGLYVVEYVYEFLDYLVNPDVDDFQTKVSLNFSFLKVSWENFIS